METLGFDYGQRLAVELTARIAVRDAIAVAFPGWTPRLGADHSLDIRAFGAIGETALTTDQAIFMSGRGLPSTFVPGRNLVFLTYAAALADFLGTISLPWNKGEAARTERFNRLLEQTREGPHAEIVNEVVLRTQMQAHYSPENIGHFGLNLDRYAHFTSPIRRYADLVVPGPWCGR